MNTLHHSKDNKYDLLNLQLYDRPGLSSASQNTLWYLHLRRHLLWYWKSTECYDLRALLLVIMKVNIVLSIHNKHLKVKSFIYWHHFGTRSSGWVALFKWRENKFFLEKLRVWQWKGQENREICSLTVLVHYATDIKRYRFIYLKNLAVKRTMSRHLIYMDRFISVLW